LLEHDTAGDPITGIRWTHKTPSGIAELLRQLDIEISANTVARLLHNMDFSLRVNRKAVATDASPDRDQQFRHISSLRTRFERQGLPIISVHTKKPKTSRCMPAARSRHPQTQSRNPESAEYRHSSWHGWFGPPPRSASQPKLPASSAGRFRDGAQPYCRSRTSNALLGWPLPCAPAS
jgi:hypothetical protein